MIKRGRKSAADLAHAVSPANKRLPPPKSLSDQERVLWLEIVNARGPEWFREENSSALERYVKQKVSATQLERQIAKEFKGQIPKGNVDLIRYKRLHFIYSKTSGELSKLERQMRLTQSSRYSKGKSDNREGKVSITKAHKTSEVDGYWPIKKGESRGARNIRWIEENCIIPEGKKVGQLAVLTTKQRAWVKSIYDTPTRTFILSMGRKGAKTAFSSFLLLLHLAGPEARANSQLYSTGQSRDQAGILFGYGAKCVRMSPGLRDLVGIRDTAKQLYCSSFGTLYRALSADANTSYGLSPIFVVHDELGQVRGPRSEMYEALETAGAAQEHPLSIIISTQAPSSDDLLSMLIDDAKTAADPMTKIELYEAPLDEDPFTEKAIRAANPHYDDFMNKDEVRRQAEDAKRLPSRESAYRNLVLNQRIESREAPLISRDVWLSNAKPPNSLKGQDVYGGLDLSSVTDLTALVLATQDGDVVPTFWLPKEGLVEKSRVDRVPYDIWEEKGHLLTTPGRAIEYEFVAEYLRGVFDTYTIKALAFDRYNMRFLKPWLLKVGFSDSEMERFVEFGQGFVSMSPALRELETRLLSDKLRHGNHPVLTMCAINAIPSKDPAGNRKLVKNKRTGRIDGMVALTMAVGVMPTQAVPEKQKFQFFVV